MKKFLAMLLSLSIILSLSIPAFAADNNENTATITGVSITVDGTTYTDGTVTLTPDSGDVTITVTGEKSPKRHRG